MTTIESLSEETIKCLQKLVDNGGKVSISRGISGLAARYNTGREPVLFGEEEFEFAVQKAWLVAHPMSGSQTNYTITPTGRAAAGSDTKTINQESIKCLKHLIANGGKVSVSLGISGAAARYTNGSGQVLYGEEEFDFATMKGWLSVSRISSSQTDYVVTPTGREVVSLDS